MRRVYAAMAFLLFILSHSPSWAMEHYVNTVQDQQGNAIPGTRITVYQAGTTELASLYSGNSVDPKANPFFNASNGTYDFYASNGAYDIQFHRSGTDFTTANVTYTGVVLYDPTDGAATLGLDGNFNVGPEILGATSANPMIVGNGTQKLDLFGDPTMGGTMRPNPLGDSIWHVWPTFSGCVKDESAVALVFCFVPSGSTPKEKYPFQPGYYPLKSFYVSAQMITGDGTNCPTSPTLVTISNSSRYSHICTENNSSRRKFVVPMRPNWDGGVIYIKPYYSQTAADTGSVLLDVAAACRALGTAFNGTYGTEVNVDDAVLAGSGAIEGTLSGAITPNGSCAAGYELFVYMDVDATTNPTTAAATLNFLGVDVFYSETSLSH